MNIIQKLKTYARQHPFRFVLISAIVVRVIAVFFAKGFMASDDYFVYIHIPWEWFRGIPSWFNMDHASGFSIIYPGLNWLLMVVLNFVGLTNPDLVMYINRAIHASWSLVGVALAFITTNYLTEKKETAFIAGMLAALFSFLPYGSVRNLPEMVCVPLVLLYLYNAEKANRIEMFKYAFLSGLSIGAAFLFRYHTLLFAVGAGLVFLFNRKWRLFGAFVIGVSIPMLLQGVVDLIAYGKFFGAPLQYFFYNIEHSTEYVVGPWHRYLTLLLGMLIPPFSILFIAAVFGAYKKAPITLIGTLTFVIIHSIYPAKQERFIIPAIIPLIVLGVIGLSNWMSSERAIRFRTTVKWLWVWFWSFNAILLILFLFHYGKRGQIEAFNELYRRGDLRMLVIDRTAKFNWFPIYYLGLGEDRCYWITNESDWEALTSVVNDTVRSPNYAFINVPKDINEHIKRIYESGYKAEIIGNYGPAPLEWILAKANPRFNSTNEVWLLKLEPR